MNEAETRAELIDPKLKENGWDNKLNAEIKVHREFPIAPGKIQPGGRRKNPKFADYILAFKGRKLAVIEAKSDECVIGEGVHQAKDYAQKLEIDNAYSANGKETYYINMKTAAEASSDDFHSPDELWNITFPKSKRDQKLFVEKFDALQNETKKLEAIYQKKINHLEELRKRFFKKFLMANLKPKLF